MALTPRHRLQAPAWGKALEVSGNSVGPGLVFESGSNYDARLAEVERALEQDRNPFLEAARVLLRSLAELPVELNAEGVHGLHTLLTRELHTFTRLCEQVNLRREHMLAVRYALCTALDESISRKPWAGGEAQQTGMWSTQALLNQFHGENEGGKTVFLLIGRLAHAADEHMHVLEVIHHLLSLGFMGSYQVESDGHRMVETIRHRLYTLVVAGREPVARELSSQWKGVVSGKFKLLRSIPVWVSASTVAIALFAQFSWYKYGLLHQSGDVERSVEALAYLQPAQLQQQARAIDLPTLLRDEIANGQVNVIEDEQHTLVVFTGDGMFSGGLDKLSIGSMLTLEKVATALKQVDGSLDVIGHTDNQPIATSEFPSNQVLSEKRAQSVRNLLLLKGVAAARMQAIGKGDTQPVATNATHAGRAANRRVEIELLPNPSQKNGQ